MPIKYSIPSRASKNNGTLRCTIPQEIVSELKIKCGDRIVWKLHDDLKVEIEIEKKS